VVPAPAAPAATLGKKLDVEASESAAPRGSWIQLKRVKMDVPEDECRVPDYWANRLMSPGDQKLEEVSAEEQAVLQQMVSSTFKSIRTRDRRSTLPSGLKIVQALRIENTDLWMKYTSGRHAIRSKRPHKCTPVTTYGGEVVTVRSLPSANKRTLQPRVNEAYFWHGTSPKGALGISSEGFRLRYAGTNVGTMYGAGLYFAECSSKSDEYAVDDQDGIYKGLYCLLLCRAVLGEVLHMAVGGEATHGVIKEAIEGEAYDSVLGDREASVGTYREFIVYQEDQAYPEYLLLYKRE